MQTLRTGSLPPRCLRPDVRSPARLFGARAVAQNSRNGPPRDVKDKINAPAERKSVIREFPILKTPRLRRSDLRGPLPESVEQPKIKKQASPSVRTFPASQPESAPRRLRNTRTSVVQSEIFDELFPAEAPKSSDGTATAAPKAKRHVPRVPLDIDTAAPHRTNGGLDVEKWLESKGDDVDKESLRAALEMHPEKPRRSVEWNTEPRKVMESELDFKLHSEPHGYVHDHTKFKSAPLEESGANESMGSNQSPWLSPNENINGHVKEGSRSNMAIGQERKDYGLLVLHGASTLLTEVDFRHLVHNISGKHIEKWVSESPLLKVVRGRNKWTLARNGDYYITFDSEVSAQKYWEDAHKIHNMANARFRRNMEKLIPSVPSSEYDPSTLESLLDGYTLAAPLAKLDLELKKPPWPPLIRSIIELSGYEELEKGRQSEHEVLLSVEGALLRRSQILSCLANEPSRYGNVPRGFAEPLKVRAFELNSPYAAKAADVNLNPSDKQWNKRKDAAYQRRRFIIPFESGVEAERFVAAWHRRDIGDLLDGFDGKSIIVNAELTW